MKISRELAIKELCEIINNLNGWKKELENPKYMNIKDDGSIEEEFCYDQSEDGKPLINPLVSVSDMEDVQIQQLRSELIYCAHKLEALATS